MRIEFNDLEGRDLIIDCIYCGDNTHGNINDEPLHKLFPKCGNQGGFRPVYKIDENGRYIKEDGKKKLAYVVLTTGFDEIEWPDFIDEETGIFRYYGDNKKSGREYTQTRHGGNKILEEVFSLLNSNESLDSMPPFFVFKTMAGRDFKFLGLAVPGNPNISPDNELKFIWKTLNEDRFPNYEAYFTILDTGETPISWDWLDGLVYPHKNKSRYAPEVWNKFISEGREGIKPLKAPRIHKIPSAQEQKNYDSDGERCLKIILEHYTPNRHDFEAFAVDLIEKMDDNFINFKLTRKVRDGGYDAIGEYQISSESKINFPLKMDCYLEAKCYAPTTSVGAKDMSRLISRIKHRQFGIIVTTSYVNTTTYKEIVEDQHPILIITGSDIIRMLKSRSIDSSNIQEHLESIDRNIERMD